MRVLLGGGLVRDPLAAESLDLFLQLLVLGLRAEEVGGPSVGVLEGSSHALAGDFEGHRDGDADSLSAVQGSALRLAEVDRDERYRDEYEGDGDQPSPEGTTRSWKGAFRPSDVGVQDGKPCCSLPRHGSQQSRALCGARGRLPSGGGRCGCGPSLRGG